MPAAADIREKADAGLGHGEGGAFGDHPHLCGQGNAHPAAHDHAIHQGDDRLFKGHQEGVELIFDKEEAPGLHPIPGAAFGEHPDIAARAETPSLGMVDQHRLDRRIGTPRNERRQHGFAHAKIKGVKGLGPVERQAPDAVFDADQHFGGVAHDFSISRAMITRMISLAPSSIWCTRRSRTIRSKG